MITFFYKSNDVSSFSFKFIDNDNFLVTEAEKDFANRGAQDQKFQVTWIKATIDNYEALYSVS